MSVSVPEPTRAEAGTRRDAFISYSRRDRDFARVLCNALRAYRPPKDLAVPQRPLDIFRDEEDFTGVDYHRAVSGHLEQSSRLLLVCSPNARQSQYVDDEVRHFAAKRGGDAIIPILIGGVPNNEAQPEQESQMAFPVALCALLEMPLAIDYRGFDASRDRVNKGAFQTQWYAILAAIHGRRRSEIEQREKRRDARRRRLTRGIVASVMAMLGTATIVSLLFWRQAVEQRTVAVARQLAAQAELTRSQGMNRIEQSVLLAVESMKRAPTLEAELVLRPQLRLMPRVLGSVPWRNYLYEATWSANRSHALVSSATDLEIVDVSSDRRVALIAPLTSVAGMHLSPDGRLLVLDRGPVYSGEREHIVQVWDVEEPRELFSVRQTEGIDAVAFAHDGHSFATVGGPHAYVWDALTGKQLAQRFRDHTILSVALNADGSRLYTSNNRGAREIWDVTRGAVDLRAKLHADRPDLVFNRDWSRIAAVEGNTVDLIETSDDREIARLSAPDQRHVGFTADGSWLFAYLRSGEVVVWRASDGEEIARVDAGAKSDAISTQLIVSSDRKRFVTDSDGGLWKIWELPGNEIGRLYQERGDPIDFSVDGHRLFFSDGSRNVRIWGVTEGREVARLPHGDLVTDILYGLDGTRLVTVDDDQDLRVWDVPTGREVVRIKHSLESVARSANGRALASAGDGPVKVLDVGTGRELAALKVEEAVSRVLFSSDGSLIATASLDSVARIWEASSGKQVAAMRHDDGLASMALSPDGKTLATSTINHNTLSIWNVATGRESARVRENATIDRLLFTADGRVLVGASAQLDDGTVLFIDPATGRVIRRLSHKAVLEVATSPDGSYIAAGGTDGSVTVWRRSNGQPVSRLVHTGMITAMVFANGGATLVTGAADGAARVWHVESGRELSRIQLASAVMSVAVSPDGSQLATGSQGFVHIWYTKPGDLVAEACRRLARNMTRAEWTRFVVGEPYSATCPDLPPGQ